MSEAQIDPNNIDLSGDFDDQINNILKSIRLSRKEVEGVELLFMQLEKYLRKAWPGCKVVPFGSIVTGLGIKSSDVDCFVQVPEQCRSSRTVITARNILRKQPWLFQNCFAITTAKVPILKFHHVPTNWACDVNFTSPSGVQKSHLLGYLLQLDRRALVLAILIKYWSKVHTLTGTNRVPNYSVTLLVIFYLQQLEILPPVRCLQHPNYTCIVDNWNTGFNANFNYRNSNALSVYRMLGGFFKFYSEVDFQNTIISTYTGKLEPKDQWKTDESVPNEFDLYKHNVSNKICKPLMTDSEICMQDPFEHNRNPTVGVYPRLAKYLIEYFKLGAQIFETSDRNTFMTDILSRKPPPMPVKVKHISPTNQQHNLHKPAIKDGRIKKQKHNINNLIDLKAVFNKMANKS